MNIKAFFAQALAALTLIASSQAFASDYAHSSAAVGGYDLVSYHGEGGPQLGNGHHVSVHDNITYLFANEANQKAFEANPAKYLPAYGGYCAFGVSKGTKFYGDPTVWKVVEGTLYLNLDTKIQKLWVGDLNDNIVEGDKLWASIKYTPASEL